MTRWTNSNSRCSPGNSGRQNGWAVTESSSAAHRFGLGNLTIGSCIDYGRGESPSAMVKWYAMTKMAAGSTCRLALAGAASLALLGVGVETALAETPASDGKGYIDSTARCTSPDIAVVFGSTASSRVAICRDSSGNYEYRGVRVRDGAKLILVAAPDGTGGFVAASDGVTYTVTASALEVSAGSKIVRDEAWVDFHGTIPSAPATGTTTGTTAPTATATVTQTATATPTPVPPVKPLPAEVGGSAANAG